jgi:hypothetical protein
MNKDQFRQRLIKVRSKINELVEQGTNILYTATFTIEGKKQKLIDLAEYDKFVLLGRLMKYETPSMLRLEWFDKQDPRNPIEVRDFDFENPAPAVDRPAFTGFGEAEINQIVDQRMAERQRLVEHEELKEYVREITAENKDLIKQVQQLEDERDHLDAALEQKKSIRYYAGMLGDILESFGIKRDKIKKPLAELMGVDEENEQPKQVAAPQEDESGIVDEPQSPEERKKAEIIDLIYQYLQSLPLMTLAKVFQVFSAIEQSPFVADELLEYLKNRKTPQP